MKLGHIEIFVRDPRTAMAFYEEVLGFEVIEVQGDQFVWLNGGGIEILLRPGRNDCIAENYQDSGIALVLYTDDLEQTVAEWEAQGLVFEGTDGLDHFKTFTDLDGNWIQLAGH